ncbi:hypothetical protein PR202_gb04224 [Eleusine coracana subsp. coracana]|uniref:Uncharacterized protein n=1 Tax=Eleusine coracana subsp. coracana TaxID=191504 RepID=A0AAV5E1J3_ELECO|nr:hypothetical protein PR202_gb04224 [Eleusine coracana subsp. coracana]
MLRRNPSPVVSAPLTLSISNPVRIWDLEAVAPALEEDQEYERWRVKTWRIRGGKEKVDEAMRVPPH